jgi:hypothetical protein
VISLTGGGSDPPTAHVAANGEAEVTVKQRFPEALIDLGHNPLVEIEIVAGPCRISGIWLRFFGVSPVGGRGHLFYCHAAPPNGRIAASAADASRSS